MYQVFPGGSRASSLFSACFWGLLSFILLFVQPVLADTVLEVGEEHFLRHELNETVNSLLPSAAYHGDITEKTRQKYTRKAIDLLIDRALLYREAIQEGFKPDSDAVEKAEQRNIKHFGSRKEFVKKLNESGLTMVRFKQRVISENVITKYVNETLVAKAKYSDKALRAYYDNNPKEFQRPESVGVWHIILKVAPNAPAAEWKKKHKLAQSLMKQLKAGKDFAELASKHSEDDYRVKGGWIGFMHKGRLLQELEDVVFSLKQGAVAGPIKTLQGYHIVKAGERKSAGKVPFKETRAKLKKRLEQQRYSKLRQAVLDKQRKQVKIKVLINLDPKA